MNKKKLAKAVLKESRKLKKLEKRQKRDRRGSGKRVAGGCKLLKVLGKLFGLFAALYAALFTVFFFDLDGKLLYYVVEPFLVKHYDKMERKNPLDMPYEMK